MMRKGLLFISLVAAPLFSCAAHELAINTPISRCEVTSLSEAARNPVLHSGRTICATGFINVDDRILHLTPTRNAEPNYEGVAFLVDINTERSIKNSNVTGTVRIYFEGILNPLEGCFSEPREPGHMCVPFDHPVFIEVSSFRRVD